MDKHDFKSHTTFPQLAKTIATLTAPQTPAMGAGVPQYLSTYKLAFSNEK